MHKISQVNGQILEQKRKDESCISGVFIYGKEKVGTCSKADNCNCCRYSYRAVYAGGCLQTGGHTVGNIQQLP